MGVAEKSGPFIKVNCAAISRELIESELFGYQRGAFTGALTDKIGKFEAAHNGSIFLDEIGELSLETQAKLLQVLDEKRFTRGGGIKEIEVDFRVISATNKNLDMEVKKGNFRHDLFYRINETQIIVPPLRERREDIYLLVKYFTPLLCEEENLEYKEFTDDSINPFINYHWPGNIRELKNLLKGILIHHKGKEIDLEFVGFWFRDYLSEEINKDVIPAVNLREAREKFEREFVLNTLIANDWSISKTAEELEMERTGLYRKMKHLGIERGKFS